MNKIELALDLINFMDFGVYLTTDEEGNECLALNDYQSANLGDIEDDRFRDLVEIIDRMEIYENDYIIEEIDYKLEENNVEFDYDSWEDLYCQLLQLVNKGTIDETEFKGYIDYLDIIVNAHNYEELQDFEEIKEYMEER